MISMRPLLPLAGLGSFLLFSTLPAQALKTDWATTEGGRMRIVVDPLPDREGIIRGALEIDLAPGWKTYWTDPGASGIPPQIDLSGSRGIALEAVHLPAPVRVDDGYTVWAGYKQPVSFALEMTADGAARLEAEVFIGICEKICVPFQADFELDIPAPGDIRATDAASQAVVDAAYLGLPAAPSEDFRVVSLKRADAQEDRLAVTLDLPAWRPAGAVPSLFLTGPDGFLFGTPELVRDADRTALFHVPVHEWPQSAGAAQAPLELVVTLGQRAIETERAIAD